MYNYTSYVVIVYNYFYLEVIDKETAVSAAKRLKEEFSRLLAIAYLVVSAADVGLFKVCVTWFLTNSARQTTPQVHQHLEKLDTIPTSLGVLNYLIRNNFIGYLNYKLLKEFQTMVTESEELDGSKNLVKLKTCKQSEIYQVVIIFTSNTVKQLSLSNLEMKKLSNRTY